MLKAPKNTPRFGDLEPKRLSRSRLGVGAGGVPRFILPSGPLGAGWPGVVRFEDWRL